MDRDPAYYVLRGLEQSWNLIEAALGTAILWGVVACCPKRLSLFVPPGSVDYGLVNEDYSLVIAGVPDSLRSLSLRWCRRLKRVADLPSIMSSIYIGSCPGLRDFSFLPTDRVDSLELRCLPGLCTFDEGPAEIGHLVIFDCEQLVSLRGIGKITGSLEISRCPSLDLRTIPSSVQTLRLIDTTFTRSQLPEGLKLLRLNNMTVDGSQLPENLQSLSLGKCHFDLKSLPRGLRALGIVDSCLQSLEGIPEDLESLVLQNCDRLESYRDLPLFLSHIVLVGNRRARDFPRLRHLKTAELNWVMTEERSPQGEPVSGASAGTVYTDGESYLADSRSWTKRPPTVSE